MSYRGSSARSSLEEGRMGKGVAGSFAPLPANSSEKFIRVDDHVTMKNFLDKNMCDNRWSFCASISL